ncbi:MAG TPA: hypothetical protein VEA41_02780 [Salinarimonas sp.]|nr:hypothetical protein [Salinarimonas sp.]
MRRRRDRTDYVVVGPGTGRGAAALALRGLAGASGRGAGAVTVFERLAVVFGFRRHGVDLGLGLAGLLREGVAAEQ